GKDLVYDALVHGEANVITLTALAVITNILLSYSGYLAGVYPFVGKLPEKLKDVHLPSVLMWLPPVLLAVCGILFGILPSLVDKSLIPGMATALGITGDLEPLKIWHGFNVVLVLSAVTIAGGVILYCILTPSTGRWEWVLRFDAVSPQVTSGKLVLVTETFADRFTNFMHNGFLRSYL